MLTHERRTFFVLLPVLLIAWLFPVHSTLSHSGASGIVLQRMQAMSDMQDNAKALALMFKGKAPLNAKKIRHAAQVFEDHGAKIPDQFPDTTYSRTGGKTEALPAIWSESKKFREMTDEFVRRAKALREVAESSDDRSAWRRAFTSVGKSCRGCHKRFKEQD